nr:tyrosine recombinase XerC [uncultured Dethiosulfovibrio sp.]
MSIHICDAIDGFIHRIQSSGASIHTVTNYGVDLVQFSDYLEGQQKPFLEDLEINLIRSFIRTLSGYGFAPASVNRKLSAVKSLMKHLKKEGLIDRDPSSRVRGPSISERLPRAISVKEVFKVIDMAYDSDQGLRNGTLLELMYGSGLRVAEVVSLKWEDLELEERWLKVMGKGSKERAVPFCSMAQKALMGIKAQSPNDYFVFPGKRGGHLTVRTVHRIVVEAAARAGLSDVSPHSLRHSFATHLLEGGASLRVVQELLGHEHLTTTQVYLRITAQHLRSSYESAHPRAGG